MRKLDSALCILCVLAFATLASGATSTFQQGDANGYSGTVDTYVNSTNAGGSFGTADAIQMNSGTVR